jgi:hypothetical protein
MSLVVAALNRLRTTLSCTVLVLHHTKKDGEVERGSSVLRGASDTMVQVTLDADEVHTVSCAKQRDGRPFEPLSFVRMPSASSVVLVPSASARRDTSRPTGAALTVLSVLVDLFDAAEGVSFTAWFKVAYPDNRTGDNRTFRRALKSLIAGHWIARRGAGERAPYVATDAGRTAVQCARGTQRHFRGTPPNASDQSQRHKEAPPFRGASNASNGADASGAESTDPEQPQTQPELCGCGEPAVAWSADDGWCAPCWAKRCEP